MARLFSFTLLTLSAAVAQAQPTPDADARVGKAIVVQQAMSTAREHLRNKKPAEAVAVLEAEILYVNGNTGYLALMKDAYLASLRDLQQRKVEPERQDHIRRQLRILDPKLDLNAVVVEPTKTADPVVPTIDTIQPPIIVEGPKRDDDPFQQIPIDRQPQGDFKAKAAEAFALKKYSEAAVLFDKALQARQELTAEERQALGYCRLHDVVLRLNNKGAMSGAMLADLEKKARDAAQLGGPSLAKFSDEVLTEIRRRKNDASPAETTAVPDGWQAIESGSFRVLYQQAREQAGGIASAAEMIRTATFEKWSGPAGSDWSPRCDVWLHASAADYAKATGKPAASPGHASVGLNGGKVQARRIDVRADDTSLMSVTLPREVAYTVVADLFPEQPLPRWADVGITMLATPDAEVARYRRAVVKLAQDRKLFAVRDFLKMPDFPEAEHITPFYVESVSLVDYLVRLKGAKAFALYLREAPRRGYEEALQRHYGIKDAADLQERWIRAATAGE